jgi:hypothetical protein
VNGCEGINPEAVPDMLEALERFIRVYGPDRGYYEMKSNLDEIKGAITKARSGP